MNISSVLLPSSLLPPFLWSDLCFLCNDIVITSTTHLHNSIQSTFWRTVMESHHRIHFSVLDSCRLPGIGADLLNVFWEPPTTQRFLRLCSSFFCSSLFSFCCSHWINPMALFPSSSFLSFPFCDWVLSLWILFLILAFSF